jgi:hypothetical protein
VLDYDDTGSRWEQAAHYDAAGNAIELPQGMVLIRDEGPGLANRAIVSSDRTIMLAAIKSRLLPAQESNTGRLLEYCSEALRMDREVVLASGGAIASSTAEQAPRIVSSTAEQAPRIVSSTAEQAPPMSVLLASLHSRAILSTTDTSVGPLSTSDR